MISTAMKRTSHRDIISILEKISLTPMIYSECSSEVEAQKCSSGAADNLEGINFIEVDSINKIEHRKILDFRCYNRYFHYY